MITLPVNNNTSVSDIYKTAHTVRGLIKRGFTSLAIHNETGMPIPAIDIMIAEYGVDDAINNKEKQDE